MEESLYLINNKILINKNIKTEKNGKDEEPYIILSKQILVTKYSNPNTINNFINNQLDQALNDFNFNLDNKFHFLILKFKKINVLV